MRHAEPLWSDDYPSDHDRPLTESGKLTAQAVGAHLVARNYSPDIIWSSDAARTRQTAMGLIRSIEGAQTVLYNQHLYHASAEQMISICEQEEEPSGNLMVLGHNPGISALHQHLSARSQNYNQAFCAVFSRQEIKAENWMSPICWRLIETIDPRDLKL